jgi:hypothetical protein
MTIRRKVIPFLAGSLGFDPTRYSDDVSLVL